MNTYLQGGILAIAFALGWFTCDKFNEADKVAQQQALTKAVLQNDKLKQDLERKKYEADTVVDALLSRKPPVVRLPTLACISNPSNGGVQDDASARLFSEQAGRVLDSDRQRTKEIIGECERTVNSCRVVVEWAASIGK